MTKKVPRTLKFLKVKPSKDARKLGPCAEQLQTLVACWRTRGVDSSGCKDAVVALQACAAAGKQPVPKHREYWKKARLGDSKESMLLNSLLNDAFNKLNK